MILILTTVTDISSDYVIDWLEYFGKKYIRLNSFDLLSKKMEISIDKEKTTIKVGSEKIDSNSVKSVWFRKFGFYESSVHHDEASHLFKPNVLNHLSKEFYKILNFITDSLKDSHWLTDPTKVNLNKLSVLRLASLCGFNTPDTKIVNNIECVDELDNLIVKSIYDPGIIHFNGANFMSYTSLFSKKTRNNIPAFFSFFNSKK